VLLYKLRRCVRLRISYQHYRQTRQVDRAVHFIAVGLNATDARLGALKMQDKTLHDRTMTDKLAGPDFAGQDNDGQEKQHA